VVTSWRFPVAAVPLVLGAVGMVLVLLFALRRRPPHGAPALVLLAVSVAIYDLGYAFELGATTLHDVALALKIEYLGVVNLPTSVLFVALAYAGTQRVLSPPTVALACLIPAVTCVLALTNERHHLIWRGLTFDASGAFTRTHFERGYWYWAHNGYAYLLLGGAALVIAVERSRVRGLFRRQLSVLLVGLFIPILIHALYLVTPFFGGLDPNPYAMSVTAVVLAWGMLDARLWDVVPIAREAVLAGVGDPVVVVDRGGRLADLNPAAQELLPERGAQAVGRPAGEVFPAWVNALARAGAGEPVREEMSLVVQGQTRHFDANFTPLAPGGGGAVLLLHDITERLEAQRLKQALTRTMVHDLRNPLTVIHGALELLQGESDRLTSLQRELVDLGSEGSRRLLDLVNAILDIERLRSGTLPLAKTAEDLASLVREAARLQSTLAAGKEQRLEVEVPEGLPPVEADRPIVSRVLQNLIGNAVKFTPRGGRILVGARLCPGERVVEVTIADDGPGVPAELRERLFGEFVTGEHAERGSGLGLAFCRLAVEAHGGRIAVVSDPGSGATFRFTLPTPAA